MIRVVDGWDSHLPMLLVAFERTTGPVLEFGAGHCSTPLLHALCHAQKRPLLTLESNPEWWAKFEPLATEDHEIRLLEDWIGWEGAYAEREWGLVFIDHSPSDHRVKVIAKVAGNTVAVIHDAERKDGGQREAIDTAPFRQYLKPRARQPWTATVSCKPLPFSERDVRAA